MLACWRAPLRGIDFGADRDPYLREGHVPPEELDDAPVYRLLLVGDAGEPLRDDPTLALLGEWGDAYPQRTAAIFLGDNIYPAGLQESSRRRGEAILLQQIRATRARKIFIPGNHDWGYTGFQRIAPGALLNQQRFVERHADRRAEFEPKYGCPGPVARPLLAQTPVLAGGLTVIVLDLYWWLLPESSRPVCDGIASTDDFIDRLRGELEARKKENVVVVSHHPIRSGGPHGGFTRGFWFDLGVAIYYRFFTVQDLVEPTYREMVAVLGEVLQENPPLAMAGGHDHSLQILDGESDARLVVVSGSATDVTGVTSLDQTYFAHAHKGFIAFDFHSIPGEPDGAVAVHAIETGRGKKPVFSLALDLHREEAPPERVARKSVPAP